MDACLNLFAALAVLLRVHFGFTYGERARSLVVAGCGYGAEPAKRQQFLEETAATAKRIEDLGMAKAAESARASATDSAETLATALEDLITSRVDKMSKKVSGAA